MPILKQIDAAPLLNDPTIVLDLGDLKRQADRLIAAAEQEAERILVAARTAAEDEGRRLRAEAEALGRTEGEQAGREAGAAAGRAEAMTAAQGSLGQLQAAWAGALEDWNGRRAADLAAGREDVVALGIAIAERLVQRTIDADPSVVVDQAGAALDLLSQAREVRVAINETDRPRIDEALPDLVRRLGAEATVRIVSDDSIEPGGVIVRSGDGMIDARIGVQLDRIAESLVPGRETLLPTTEATDAEGEVGAADATTPADEPAAEAGDERSGDEDQSFGAAA